ncbi:hypothetical protein HAX54_047093 [Datura stramonium]|uniref:Uncharacterized protein n=1 Tax=Datura stramonium TaxID=4076 RepID=A0ABS8SSI7_DATST|nr:hypothetical protein [Datura stramonium]
MKGGPVKEGEDERRRGCGDGFADSVAMVMRVSPEISEGERGGEGSEEGKRTAGVSGSAAAVVRRSRRPETLGRCFGWCRRAVEREGDESGGQRYRDSPENGVRKEKKRGVGGLERERGKMGSEKSFRVFWVLKEDG